MNINKQETAYNVHLRKAKRAINFIFILLLISLLPTLSSSNFDSYFFISAISFVALFISSRSIYKYPVFAVISLGFMILFYLYSLYSFLYVANSTSSINTKSFLFYFILTIRTFVTLIVIQGFLSAIKGMIGKEQFEKKYETLDEDEM